MVIEDEYGWLGADGRYFPSSSHAHESITKAHEAMKLKSRLEEIEEFQKSGWTHPYHTNVSTNLPHSSNKDQSANSTGFDYDVALSFAGEQRQYVEDVANALRKNNIRVFYDDFEKEELWGKNLYDYLNEIYNKKT